MPQPEKKHRQRRQIPANALVVPLAIFAQRTGISANQLRRFAGEGMPVLRLDRIIRVEVERAMAWLRARSAPPRTPAQDASQGGSADAR